MSHFTPTHRIAVSYIDKSRELYLHRGFGNPYRWASHTDAPFAKLNKPLSECTIGVVTTAVPNEAAGKERKLWSAPCDPIPENLFTQHLSWHKTETHMDDVGSFLPLGHLKDAAEQGRVGGLSSRFYGIRTTFSQRQTNQEDGPAVLEMVRQDGVDAVVLIPIWPICHQAVSLVSRYLEANGIPTVVIGSAKDIVEQCGVSRYVFTDFPLGNPVGKPGDVEMQKAILEMSFKLLEGAVFPRTTVQAPYVWNAEDDVSWRKSFMEF